ncbi:diguanylate cyclase [Metabacillus litoralis]|uniref:Diguanylate cyclase n=1 Tax=Metabacillus litoralis TaxID=152268 RepID=A0A5C6W639_9BACI|nr:diguanylate cyclase [Metabacillus litoralis]TXC91291.1 diguanylate cyclase [Metabacillus litoralis]
MSRINLRTFFAISFLCFIVLLTASLTIVLSMKSSNEIKDEIGDSTSNIAYQMSDKLDFFMWSRYSEIEMLSQLNLFKEDQNNNDKKVLINSLQESIPAFSWVGLTDANGNIVVSTDDILTGANIAERPVFKEATKQPFIGDVHEAVLLAELLPNPSGVPLEFVDISFPIVNNNGDFKGVLATHLSWEWSREIENSIIKPYRKNLENSKQMEVFIVSSSDQTILLGPEKMLGKTLSPNILKREYALNNSWEIKKWSDGKEYLTGYSIGDGYLNYPGLDWTIIVRIPVEQAFTSVKNLQDYTILIGIIAAVIFAILGWFLASKISTPLNEISKAANQLKEGNKVDIPQFKRIKDLHVLSVSLREMVATITETKSELGQMKRLAHNDSLTGLPNRIALYSYIDKKLESEANEKYLFLFLDLDGFKDVNDTYGHQAGDQLLKVVANRLQQLAEEDDFVGRLGGDEFIIIARSKTSSPLEEGKELGQQIIESINKSISLNEKDEVVIKCSIGGAIWPDYSIEPDDIIQLADEALYQSKRTGKNKFTFYKI